MRSSTWLPGLPLGADGRLHEAHHRAGVDDEQQGLAAGDGGADPDAVILQRDAGDYWPYGGLGEEAVRAEQGQRGKPAQDGAAP